MVDFRIIGPVILLAKFPTDTVFTLETVDPPITWNVTRLERDAAAGRFGPPVSIPMDRLPGPNWSTGNLERKRVDWIKAHPEILNKPSLVIASPPGSPFPYFCFCDGNHRGTARWELKLPDVWFYVIPADIEKDYRVSVEEVLP